MVRRGDWETYFCFLLSRFQLFPTFGTTSARPWHDLDRHQTPANTALARRHDLYPRKQGGERRGDAEMARDGDTTGQRQNHGQSLIPP